MSRVLLDSDVVIKILKKKEETLTKLKSILDEKLAISVITVAEIYAGVRKNEIATVEKLFSYFEIVNIDKEIAKIAGEYANKYKKAYNGISLENYLIAATVKAKGYILWSYNKKYYPMKDIELFK
jgi:predicted nucleic acid-binding protein